MVSCRMVPGLRDVVLVQVGVKCRVQQLQTQHAKQEKRADDLARSALCEPAVEPRKYGSHQQDVEGDKSGERHDGPGNQVTPRERRSKKNAEAAPGADDGGDIDKAEDEMQQNK